MLILKIGASKLIPVAFLLIGTNAFAVDTLFSKYQLDVEQEIVIAKSAAPKGLTDDATVWVLTEKGYTRKRNGENGFHCLVLRPWSAPFDSPDRVSTMQSWEDLLAPICYDAMAAKGNMQEQFFRARLFLEGKSLDQIREATFSAYARGELRPAPAVAFAYMMSASQNLGPDIGEWFPHLMIYAPYATGEVFMNDPMSGMPILFEGPGTARAAFIVPLSPGVIGKHIHPASD